MKMFSNKTKGAGEDNPKVAKGERLQGQGAVVTRDQKGTLQAKRGDDYVGAGTTKESAAGDRLRASTSDAGKRGNYQSGTAPMVGGSFKSTYSGPKGKVSYIKSSIVKKKNLKPMS